MKKIKTPDGIVHQFPDDATDAEISAALNAAQPPRPLTTREKIAQGARNEGIVPNWLIDAGDALGNATDQLVQGMTVGLSDEAAAAGAATGASLRDNTIGGRQPKTWAEYYNQRLEAQRGSESEFRERNPKTALGLNIVGGLGSSAAAPGAALAPMTLGQATKQGAKIGTGFGAAAGFGNAEGGIPQRLMGTAGGAAGGGLFGAVLPSAITVGGTAVQAGKNLLNLGNPIGKARDLILRALRRDGLTPAQAVARFGQWQSQGAKPEALMDLGGENVRRLARSVESVPGRATEVANRFLDERQAGQAERIMDDVGQFLPDERFHATLDSLMEQRAVMAAPLYDEAYKSNQSMMSPAINRILETPAGKAALRQAAIKMQNDMTLLGKPDPELTALMREAVELGRMKRVEGGVAAGLKLRTLDYVKRAFDDQIGTSLRAGKKDDARIMMGLKNKLKNEIIAADATARAGPKSLKPEGGAYERALKAYAGPSESMEALELGRNIFRQDAELTAKQLAEFSDSDRYFYRIGAVRAIKDRVDAAKDGADALKRFFNSKEWRAKLRPVFDSPQDFAKFESLMRREAAMYANAQKVRGGSRTAALQADQEDLIGNFGFLGNLFGGNWTAAGRQAIASAVRRGQGISGRTGEELARLLFTPSRRAIVRAGKDLTTAQQKQLIDQIATEDRIRALTMQGSRMLGQLSGSIQE